MTGFLAVPGAALAAQKADSADRGKGHISTKAEAYIANDDDLKMYAQEDYPAKLDPREEYAWYKENIKVRNQADTELCWAFSASAAAQISYIKEAQKNQGQLSPSHLGYFLYNRVNDPLGGTPKDFNEVVNYDKEKKYNDWRDEGGAAVWTFQHLATLSGLGAESDTPFVAEQVTDQEGYTSTVYAGPKSYSSDLAYGHNALIEENSFYYPKLPYTDAGRKTVKKLIKEYGAVVVSVQFEPDFYLNEDTAAYYKYDPYIKNIHEVTIVGWDDNYPVENFGSRTVLGGKKTEKPSNPGAWIVLNSWGGDDLWPEGDNGYFYASYESKDIMNDGVLALDMAVPKTDVHCFQYDGNASHQYLTPAKGDKAANVFTVPADKPQMQLTDVGFTTWTQGNMEYKVNVYVDPSTSTGGTSALKKNPEDGILASSRSVKTDSPGYKTFSLKDKVTLQPGETYSIVVSFLKKNGFGIERSGDGFKAGFKKEQSFFFDSDIGKWDDLYQGSKKACIRIKGLAEEQASCTHSFEVKDTHEAAKGLEGYTVERCSLCGYLQKNPNVTPALKPVPDGTSVKSLTSAKQKLTVKWKKSKERIAGSNIDGYKIRYSTKSSMKGAEIVKATGFSAFSKKITGLKSGKKYYVQVAPYYRDAAGKTWTAKWSKKKSARTK